MDESYLSQEKKLYYEQRAKVAIGNLLKKNINARYFPSRQKALEAVLSMIPPRAKVARGDSITIDQVGIPAGLVNRGQNPLIDPHEKTTDGLFILPDIKDRVKIAREAFTADIFLVGANAITLDGKLVSTDAWGNRVSATIFGPEKVIVVVGANKIVADVDEA